MAITWRAVVLVPWAMLEGLLNGKRPAGHPRPELDLRWLRRVATMADGWIPQATPLDLALHFHLPRAIALLAEERRRPIGMAGVDASRGASISWICGVMPSASWNSTAW